MMDLRAVYDELKTLPQEEHLYEFALANWREKAAVALAHCYEHGEGGLEQDFHEAFRWYKISAERGNRESLWKLAEFYMEGKGVRKSYVNAVNRFMSFAKEGNAEAMYRIGECHSKSLCSLQLEWDDTFKWYLKSAEYGYPTAMFKVSECYFYGFNGANRDVGEGMKWIIKAAEKGDADARYELGQIYEYGYHGIPRDKDEAAKWYGKAARQGHTRAQYRYGMYFYWNDGFKTKTERNRRAVRWLTKAAEGGCKESPYWLGSIYGDRWGGMYSLRKSAHWYRLGVSRGDDSCRTYLEMIERTLIKASSKSLRERR